MMAPLLQDYKFLNKGWMNEYNSHDKITAEYPATPKLCPWKSWINGYAEVYIEVDTRIRSDWVSAYPPMFRGFFKVAGYSAFKPFQSHKK